jgi:hypothetical protein
LPIAAPAQHHQAPAQHPQPGEWSMLHTPFTPAADVATSHLDYDGKLCLCCAKDTTHCALKLLSIQRQNVDARLHVIAQILVPGFNKFCFSVSTRCSTCCSPSPALETCRDWACPESTLVNAANATWSPPSNRACCLVRLQQGFFCRKQLLSS